MEYRLHNLICYKRDFHHNPHCSLPCAPAACHIRVWAVMSRIPMIVYVAADYGQNPDSFKIAVASHMHS